MTGAASSRSPGGERRDRSGPIILWLQQAFRLRDNPAIAQAWDLAKQGEVGLVVLHGLHAGHPLGSPRVNRFLMEAALETMARLEARGALVRELVAGKEAPLADQVAGYAMEARAGALVVDDPATYMPAANIRRATRALDGSGIPLLPVEANLVVPTRSYGRLAVGAYALRGHVMREAAEALRRPEPRLPTKLPRVDAPDPPGFPVGKCDVRMYADRTAYPQAADLGTPAGEAAAMRALDAFIETKLARYGDRAEARDAGWHSDLSPHLHFGAISPRVVATRVIGAKAPQARKDAFLEQLIVRRELAYNAARYLPTMRSLDALPDWAKATLRKHDKDRREHVYELREWERAKTHDEVWNATQLELRHRGTIHPYLRMYWGKKIIEWSASHAEARETMEILNGAWALDGRDANMWEGHLWCFGLHDRPFAERPVFGKLRWMSAEGTRRKFDVDAYAKWADAGCPAS